MACFTVTAAEAIVVGLVKKHEEKKELQLAESAQHVDMDEVKIPLSRKLKWLSNMLWGGVVLLLFEHIWHGEVVPWFPFLTAMNSAEETAVMLQEMATVGVSMAVLLTIVWLGMCFVADAIVSRKSESEEMKA